MLHTSLRAGRPVGIRSLAPRVYEGGGPKGRGEKSGILPNSPSFAPLSSPLLKAGAEGAEVISGDCHGPVGASQ